MGCPNSADCSAKSTIAIGAFLLGEADWLDEGTLIERGATEVPNQNIQRKANGDISRISQPSYVKQEITVTVSACSVAYEALWLAHINGSNCYDTVVINDPCCRPYTFKDAVITSMDPADVAIGEDVKGTVTLEAVPTS